MRSWVKRPERAHDDPRALIAHVVYRFDVGGLENGLVNLVNRMPASRFRHCIVALTDVTDFRRRVARDDVQFFELHKAPGHGVKLFPRLFRLFRRLGPDVVHTRNLAALEAAFPAWAARVPIRIHGEHGRDVGDLDGSNAAYRLVRRAYRPFVTHYVALSDDLERYLQDGVHVAAQRISRIVNGVDTTRFVPAGARAADCPFKSPELLVFGTVGRLQRVKHQTLLARAFVRALEVAPALRPRLRLVIVGQGPLHREIEAILSRAGARELAWLPGERSDVPDVLRSLDAFVLPSLAEGISNTILEAMASGVPVIATNVGGNRELVVDGVTGVLVPSDDVEVLAQTLLRMAASGSARTMGAAARAHAERHFALDVMVANYVSLYDRLLAVHRRTRAADGMAAASTQGGSS